MIHRHVVASIEDTESPVNARNRLLRKPTRHRKAAQGHDHSRVYQVDLGIEVALARIDFGRKRVAVPRRAALQDVADIDVFTPHLRGREQLFKKLPGLSHEWAALAVLVCARRLADQHHFGVERPFARDCILACPGECTAGTCADGSIEAFRPLVRRRDHPGPRRAVNTHSADGATCGRGQPFALSIRQQAPDVAAAQARQGRYPQSKGRRAAQRRGSD